MNKSLNSALVSAPFLDSARNISLSKASIMNSYFSFSCNYIAIHFFSYMICAKKLQMRLSLSFQSDERVIYVRYLLYMHQSLAQAVWDHDVDVIFGLMGDANLFFGDYFVKGCGGNWCLRLMKVARF